MNSDNSSVSSTEDQRGNVIITDSQSVDQLAEEEQNINNDFNVQSNNNNVTTSTYHYYKSDSESETEDEGKFDVEPVTYDPREPQGSVDCEIVGLFNSSNGRSCTVHKVCGKHLQVGDLVRLVKTFVFINMHHEEAVKVVKVVDGCDTCTVGFIPRVQAKLPHVVNNLDKFAMVKELYYNSESNYKLEKSKKNVGMGGLVLLELFNKNE